MPELPEVETTRRGVEKYLLGQSVVQVKVREHQLRYPVTRGLGRCLCQAQIERIARRGKYLLFYTTQGNFVVHLGMSGSLRILPLSTPSQKHDHIDWVIDNDKVLRYSDPRKFGLVLWMKKDPLEHTLLSGLGVEPLGKELNGKYLQHLAKQRSTITIKNFIMDSKVVVGIGNIYANEALYDAGIRPTSRARRLSLSRFEALVFSIKKILRRALRSGGTTLRDFVREDGSPGYFHLSLKVYGKSGAACPRCGRKIRRIVSGQRSSFYCSYCQR